MYSVCIYIQTDQQLSKIFNLLHKLWASLWS